MAKPSLRACLGLLAVTAVFMGRVSAQDVILEATPAKSAPAGSTVTVKWKGPNGPGDYITVVSTGSAANAYLDYKPTSDGRAPVNPVALVLPAKPGAYEIRYVLGNPRRVLASVPFVVTEVTATIEAPEHVMPEAKFDVSWLGPNNTGDWVAIVAADAPVSAYLSYVDARNGRADDKTSRRIATLRAPPKTGTYELRYVQQGKIVIGRRTIEVTTSPPATSGSGGAPAKPSTDGGGPTQAEGTVNAWSGWARCEIQTRTAGQTNTHYEDSQTQTWTISGAGTVDGGGTRYPATWSVSGSGSMRTSWSGPGSYSNGDHMDSVWEPRISGVAAPLLVTHRASDNKVVLSSAHARLQSQITVQRWIGNDAGTVVSPGSQTAFPEPLFELALPAIEDAATSTRLSGSSSPVVSYAVSPLQPANASTTASCTWLFEKGVTFTPLQPPPAPAHTRKTFPRPSLPRQISSAVQVLTPNGPEDWAVNSRQTVSWTHTLGAGQRFNIDISVDGGTTWLPLGRNISDDGSGSRGAFTVAMPAVGSTAGLVRVSAASNASAADVSDSGFKLGAPWLNILTPIGANVERGGRFVVQVTTNLAVSERYTIAVTYDNTSWQTVATSATSGMTVTVPATAPLTNNGPGGTVRVTSNSVPTLSATGSVRIRR